MKPSARRVSVIARGAMREKGQAFLFIQKYQLSSELPTVFVEPLDLSLDISFLH